MDSFERKELKRANASRNIWKARALDRQAELRKKDDKIRDLIESRDNWKEKSKKDQEALEDLKKKQKCQFHSNR